MADPTARSALTGLRKRMWIEWSVVALTVTLIAGLVTWSGFTARADNLFYDLNMRLAPAPPPDDIVIIAIDEASLEQFGRWPWPRVRLAQLLNVMAPAQPRAVALDILLTEPAAPQDDAQLAEAMGGIDRVLIPLQFVAPGSNGRPFDVITPIPVLQDAANATGHVNTPIDDDGAVRRAILCFAGHGETSDTPHLMQMMWQVAKADRALGQSAAAPPDKCGDTTLPRFARPGAFATMSFASVANGEIPAAFLKGRYLLIGVTAQGLGDQYATPSSANALMTGVEINANILATMFRNDFITPAPLWLQLTFAWFPLWILLALLWRMQPWQVALCVLTLAGAVILGSFAALTLGLWLAPLPALTALFLVYPLWGWRRLQATSDYMAQELERLDDNDSPLPPISSSFQAADVVTLQAEQLNLAITELRDLQRLVTDSLENLPDPAVVTNQEGNILLCNRAANIFPYDDIVGRDIMALLQAFVARSGWPDVEAFLAEQQTSDAKSLSGAPPYVAFTNRHDRWFAMRRSRLISAQGDVRGHIYYLADITTITHAQNEREEMIEFLSHDMRAPQAAILALLDQSDVLVDKDVTSRIERHARQTLLLADNFVDMARMKSDAYAPQPVLLGDLVSEAIDSVWPMANARNIVFKLNDRIGERFVNAEHSGLFRAIANLLDNAVKYSPDNGQVDVLLSQIQLGDETHARIEISDSGPGIAQDVMAHMFTKFNHKDAQSIGTLKGVGLGLYYASMVIRRHGGAIEMENRKEGGARIIVILPMEKDAMQNNAEGEPPIA